MRELCRCCEGIEQITPVSNVNRPGLSALVYRVGTHATFLETMLARLSTHYLEVTEAGAEAERHGHPTPRSHPLHGLTTRDPQDASIAFLDAWATVADVLTFYQERVANEGYLRTAIERRSVLELARLLGYQPRPGVASSTHLAYTLEDSKEATIPAGSRAQSVPGPGELPQSFETAEDLYARAEWNLLQPRLQRPQAMRREDFDVERAIYLKGTSTNLKANDPVLIDFGRRIANGLLGGNSVELFRVLKVEPEQSAGRTKVTLFPWLRQPQAAPVITPSPRQTIEQRMSRLQTFITTHRRAEDFGVNATTQMAQQVLAELENLQNHLRPTLTPAELRDMLEAALPSLSEKHRLASANNFTKLEPWIGSIVSELEENLSGLKEDLKGSQDPLPGDEPAPSASQSSLTHLTQLLESLEKPSSRQPASRQQLGTGLKDNLSESSGALPQLLAALRPELRSLLYNAWESVTITEPTVARVYALRARAAVFGNNAPLDPIPDPNTGRITEHREWTLFTRTSQQVSEQFRIEMRFTNSAPTFDLTVALLNPGNGTTGSATRPSNPIAKGSFTLNLAPGTERVVVTISDVDADANATASTATFTFDFQERDFRVVVQWNERGQSVNVTGRGNNLIEVERVVQQPQTFGVGGSVTALGAIFSTVGNLPTEQPNRVSLDASYNQILPGGWAVLERPTPLGSSPSRLVIAQVTSVTEASRANYGMTAKGTQLQLNTPWIAPVDNGDTFNVIRGTTVFAQSELLELAEELLDPIADNLCGERIELANLVSGLEPGRWLVVTGERTDIRTESTLRDEAGGATIGRASELITGVKATELVMLSGVEQGYDEQVSGDKTHTTLLLAEELAYCYKLDSVRIYGNVVRATHGETRTEVLGSGDASKAMQAFALSQQPLTYISAPTPSGIESTLQVRASDILWHETDSLAGLEPKDHKYITKTDDESKTTIIFGNGREGARLPTGAENVKAKYRTGIGKPGNVKAEQISMVITKPLGVKEVINPLAATGGADRESRDEARRNAPLAVMALDRLVSTQDYEDFTRTFAGVGKASATRLSDGRRQVVHLSIAGADDIPISTDSDLFRNLGEALRRFGDPYQPIQIATRFLKVLVTSARVRVDPDYLWETVEPKVRATVLEHFSFNRRQLGQDVVLSELIGAIQSVEGVLYVDVDTLDAVEENISTSALLQLSGQLKLNQRLRVHLAQVDKTALDPSVRLRPAQLALFTPLVPETLNLTELKG
jgi:predicted phage baseplate assembly protein